MVRERTCWILASLVEFIRTAGRAHGETTPGQIGDQFVERGDVSSLFVIPRSPDSLGRLNRCGDSFGSGLFSSMAWVCRRLPIMLLRIAKRLVGRSMVARGLNCRTEEDWRADKTAGNSERDLKPNTSAVIHAVDRVNAVLRAMQRAKSTFDVRFKIVAVGMSSAVLLFSNAHCCLAASIIRRLLMQRFFRACPVL